MAIFTGNLELFPEIEIVLEKQYGKIDCKGPVFGFNHTDYYQEEMGFNLKKKFISFKDLIDPGKLNSIKLFTNKLEGKYSNKDKRIVNIDSRYIDNSKLVLASTKDYYHRIYVGKGIYAEVTLFFKGRSFQQLSWTYPDYKIDTSIDVFNTIRGIYRKQLSN